MIDSPAPLVSIVLPVHDEAETLPACLDSIRNQTLENHEVVAIDDGSSDSSAELLQEAAAGDARIRVIAPGRVGIVGALNAGVAEARAPLIARMDGDDLMHPDRLRIQLEFMQQHPDVALVASRVEAFPANAVRAGLREYLLWQDGCLEPEEIANHIYLEAPFVHPSVLVRRTVLEEVGGYRAGEFPEDYDLWLRMHAERHLMAKLPDVLLSWRESKNRTSRTDARYSREAFDRLRARYLALDPRLQNRRPLVIWGAGRRTRRRARHLLELGHHPVAWIDIDPRKIGSTADGIPVHPPEWLDQAPLPFVLVYVTNHGARESISGALSQFGYLIGRDFLPVG